jgi:hypothetical protein
MLNTDLRTGKIRETTIRKVIRRKIVNDRSDNYCRDPFRLLWESSGDVLIVVLILNVNEVIGVRLLFMNSVMSGCKAEFAVVSRGMSIVMRAKQAETNE